MECNEFVFAASSAAIALTAWKQLALCVVMWTRSSNVSVVLSRSGRASMPPNPPTLCGPVWVCFSFLRLVPICIAPTTPCRRTHLHRGGWVFHYGGAPTLFSFQTLAFFLRFTRICVFPPSTDIIPHPTYFLSFEDFLYPLAPTQDSLCIWILPLSLFSLVFSTLPLPPLPPSFPLFTCFIVLCI